jgi:hypothetical protein
MQLIPFALIAAVLILATTVWLRRRRYDPYDLKRLWDEPPKAPDRQDEVLDDDSGPYCHSCDEPHGPGTNFCRRCGRKLG